MAITTASAGDRPCVWNRVSAFISTPLTQVVTKAATITTLFSSINPSASGKPVTFTALVSSLAGTPTGKIEYLNGTTVLATLKLTSGSAKYHTKIATWFQQHHRSL
jgi:hypothetical protein